MCWARVRASQLASQLAAPGAYSNATAAGALMALRCRAAIQSPPSCPWRLPLWRAARPVRASLADRPLLRRLSTDGKKNAASAPASSSTSALPNDTTGDTSSGAPDDGGPTCDTGASAPCAFWSVGPRMTPEVRTFMTTVATATLHVALWFVLRSCEG